MERRRWEEVDHLRETTHRKQSPDEGELRVNTRYQQGKLTEPEAKDALDTKDLAIWDMKSKRYRKRTINDEHDDSDAAREQQNFEGASTRDIEERAMDREQRKKRWEKNYHPLRTNLLSLEMQRRVARTQRDIDRGVPFGTVPTHDQSIIEEDARTDRYYKTVSEKQAEDLIPEILDELLYPEEVERKASAKLHAAYNEMKRFQSGCY